MSGLTGYLVWGLSDLTEAAVLATRLCVPRHSSEAQCLALFWLALHVLKVVPLTHS